jgi:hypothetical protein
MRPGMTCEIDDIEMTVDTITEDAQRSSLRVPTAVPVDRTALHRALRVARRACRRAARAHACENDACHGTTGNVPTVAAHAPAVPPASPATPVPTAAAHAPAVPPALPATTVPTAAEHASVVPTAVPAVAVFSATKTASCRALPNHVATADINIEAVVRSIPTASGDSLPTAAAPAASGDEPPTARAALYPTTANTQAASGDSLPTAAAPAASGDAPPTAPAASYPTTAAAPAASGDTLPTATGTAADRTVPNAGGIDPDTDTTDPDTEDPYCPYAYGSTYMCNACDEIFVKRRRWPHACKEIRHYGDFSGGYGKPGLTLCAVQQPTPEPTPRTSPTPRTVPFEFDQRHKNHKTRCALVADNGNAVSTTQHACVVAPIASGGAPPTASAASFSSKRIQVPTKGMSPGSPLRSCLKHSAPVAPVCHMAGVATIFAAPAVHHDEDESADVDLTDASIRSEFNNVLALMDAMKRDMQEVAGCLRMTLATIYDMDPQYVLDILQRLKGVRKTIDEERRIDPGDSKAYTFWEFHNKYIDDPYDQDEVQQYWNDEMLVPRFHANEEAHDDDPDDDEDAHDDDPDGDEDDPADDPDDDVPTDDEWEEHRIHPVTGEACTWAEFYAYFHDDYRMREIEAFWRNAELHAEPAAAAAPILFMRGR